MKLFFRQQPDSDQVAGGDTSVGIVRSRLAGFRTRIFSFWSSSRSEPLDDATPPRGAFLLDVYRIRVIQSNPCRRESL